MDGSAPLPRPEFSATYREHFGYVINTLRRLGARDGDLADLAHDVFVVVHRKLADFDASRPMRPWLFGIAFRTLLDAKRRHGFFRERYLADPGERVASALPLPDALVASRQAHELVQQGLAALPLEQRAVFLMHDLEGMTMPQIADVIDAPLNTLYSRLRLARDAFSATVRFLASPSGRKSGRL